MDAPKVKKESKNKIRVDFERAPLWERLKGRFFSMRFLKNVVFVLFKLVLLLGVSFVILYPYISKIADSFKTFEDFQDVTVIYISRHPNLDQYKYILTENHYFRAILNTFLISASNAFLQTLACALVGYGLAKFKFRGRNIIFGIVILTMMLPQQAVQLPMRNFFWYWGSTNPVGMLFNALGIVDQGLINSYIPLYMMSLTGFAFRNGLFIFLLRQFFTGVPDELEESAYMDGSTTFRTFFSIIIPLAIPMLVTVFIFSFSWLWTDNFYVNTLFQSSYWTTEGPPLLNSNNFVGVVPPKLNLYLGSSPTGWVAYTNAVGGTTTILVALPIIIAFVFLQGKIVQGIERSGIVG